MSKIWIKLNLNMVEKWSKIGQKIRNVLLENDQNLDKNGQKISKKIGNFLLDNGW